MSMGYCFICGEYCNKLQANKCHECRRHEYFNKNEPKEETNLDALINKLSVHGGKLTIVKQRDFKEGQLNKLIRNQFCCRLDKDFCSSDNWLILTEDERTP